MTIINGIEIDDINYKIDEIKLAILNNDPIEDKLNVIIVISNPCQYARRYILAREFVKRINENEMKQACEIVKLLGVPCMFAPEEADSQCAYLSRNNLVDYIATEDMDLLTFGSKNIIRNFNIIFILIAFHLIWENIYLYIKIYF